MWHTCPACGELFEEPAEDGTCPFCRARQLSEEATTATTTMAERLCPKCGALLESALTYCPKCGAAV